MLSVLWLRGAILFTLVSALLTGIGAAIPGGLDPVLNLLFSPMVQESLSPAGRLAAGIAAGSLAGWSVTLYVLARDLPGLSPALVGRAIAFGVVAWFGVDSSVSLAVGAPLNVLGNVVYLAILMFPALALARSQSLEQRVPR